MNTDTGEIIHFGSQEELQEAERAAQEEKLAKLEATARDIGAEIEALSEDKDYEEIYLELEKEPKANCKKCYSRGYSGRNIITNKYVPCSCTYRK